MLWLDALATLLLMAGVAGCAMLAWVASGLLEMGGPELVLGAVLAGPAIADVPNMMVPLAASADALLIAGCWAALAAVRPVPKTEADVPLAAAAAAGAPDIDRLP
jgi:hypothetical protein